MADFPYTKYPQEKHAESNEKEENRCLEQVGVTASNSDPKEWSLGDQLEQREGAMGMCGDGGEGQGRQNGNHYCM